MLNTIQISGRLTRDPKIMTSEKGIKYLKFDVAVERDFTSRSGKKVTDFLPCIAFDKQSEVISSYFRKGSKITVCGRLETDIKDNVKNFVIVTEKLYFVESKPRDSQPKSNGFRTDEAVPF